MADSPRHSVSVAAVVVDNHDRALLIRRRDNDTGSHPAVSWSSTRTSSKACAVKSARKPAYRWSLPR